MNFIGQPMNFRSLPQIVSPSSFRIVPLASTPATPLPRDREFAEPKDLENQRVAKSFEVSPGGRCTANNL